MGSGVRGLYWSVDADGRPLDDRKQFYALGFAIYGLSELYRASGDAEALASAVELFGAIEKYSYDAEHNGYLEATARDWRRADDMRLSEKDENESKTMNTHLHILEPYTNLYRALLSACDAGETVAFTFDPSALKDIVKERLVNLCGIFTERIFRPETGHLGLFFGDDWTEKSTGTFSYGHDIEASWLLLEAATAAGDERLEARVKEFAARIADASLEGYRPDGSMIYEMHPDGRVDEERHWWVQAETVVGLFYLWKFYGYDKALEMSLMTWEYIKEKLVDRNGGEWFWSITPEGAPNTQDDKAGFWKCPYHSGRMCMELINNIP